MEGFNLKKRGFDFRMTEHDPTKQDLLVSGENIKTVNGETLLGSGNVLITGETVVVDGAMSDSSINPVQNKVVKEYVDDTKHDIEENFLRKGTYDASTAVGLADNIRGDVYADEQFSLRMTGGDANEVGGIGVVQVLKGAGEKFEAPT